MIRKKSDKGTILIENVIFIILNLAFITILILFIAKQGSGEALLEQAYAKKIALIIDASKTGTEIFLDMSDAPGVSEEWWNDNYANAVKVDGNLVTVKLREKGGYSYSFFNGVTPIIDMNPEGKLYLVIRGGETESG